MILVIAYVGAVRVNDHYAGLCSGVLFVVFANAITTTLYVISSCTMLCKVRVFVCQSVCVPALIEFH